MYINQFFSNYSRLGGLVLSKAVDELHGFVIFQPIINGIGGNLVSVQASRISTTLHQTSLMGMLPPHSKISVSPWQALIKGGTQNNNKFTYLYIKKIMHKYNMIN